MAICWTIYGDGHIMDQYPVNPEPVYYVGQQDKITRPAWAIPSGTYKNPQVNAVTLRNSGELEGAPERKKEKVTPKDELVPKPVVEIEKETKESEKTTIARPPPPFPQKLKEKSDDKMFNKFLDMMSQIQLNLPLIVALTEECTSRIQRKLLQKLNLGSFTILVRTDEVDVGRALCDLRASINLMSLSVFNQLGLGAPRPTTVMLQLADRSIVNLEGVIEDVLLQIGQFILLADFIILDYEVDEHVPIILVWPLLATTNVVIKVRKKIILGVDNVKAVFNVYNAIQLPRHYKDLAMISVIEKEEEKNDVGVYLDDSLEKELMAFAALTWMMR
uniref:Uncharacterized protein LOC104219225 n=1 Tax=Nicotiana sylvestris TaxID=4096 RepID=A0A1U7VJC2_NICSY|nr:PREDICTED: uncharacterized protein LOC104219225 [Nicotiana sylvestris]